MCLMPSARACRMWSGFSSEIETERLYLIADLDELSRMWSGFSSEIETLDITTRMQSSWGRMWSGFSSEIETLSLWVYCHSLVCRMWSGFSSEIETHLRYRWKLGFRWVACGAASRLRLKRSILFTALALFSGRMWSGFSSEIETPLVVSKLALLPRSHVERLLV